MVCGMGIMDVKTAKEHISTALGLTVSMYYVSSRESVYCSSLLANVMSLLVILIKYVVIMNFCVINRLLSQTYTEALTPTPQFAIDFTE